MLIVGIGKGFLTNLVLTSQKSSSKSMVSFFFGTINVGDAHLDACCCSSTPSLHSLSISLMRVSLCIFGTGKAQPWCGIAPSFNWKETSLVFQSPKVPSKSDTYFLRSCISFFWCLAFRCLQLSLTIDWRSALLYLTSNIWVTRLVAMCYLVSWLISFSALVHRVC